MLTVTISTCGRVARFVFPVHHLLFGTLGVKQLVNKIKHEAQQSLKVRLLFDYKSIFIHLSGRYRSFSLEMTNVNHKVELEGNQSDF